MNSRIQRIGILFGGALLCAHAQWLNYPTAGTPRTRDGKADLFGKTPRASNGKPDLSGVWQTEYAPPGENERIFGASVKDYAVLGDDPRTFSKYYLNILVDFKPEDAPIRPEAAESPKGTRTHGEPKVRRHAVCRKGSRAPIFSVMLPSR